MSHLPEVTTCPPFAPGVPSHLLVVDDDPDVLGIITVILERDGYRVDTAANGEAAWHALVCGAYDLLVTDHIMSGISGLALVRQLRVADMTLPVVMVTGSLDALDTVKLSGDPWSRVDAFVSKPFTAPELRSAVHRALSRETAGAAAGRLKVG